MRDNLKINGKCNNEWQSMRFVVIKIINTYYYTLLKEKIVLGLNDINFFVIHPISHPVFRLFLCNLLCYTQTHIHNLLNNHWENVIYTHLCVSLACNIIWLLWRPMMLFSLVLCLCRQWMYRFFVSLLFFFIRSYCNLLRKSLRGY